MKVALGNKIHISLTEQSCFGYYELIYSFDFEMAQNRKEAPILSFIKQVLHNIQMSNKSQFILFNSESHLRNWEKMRKFSEWILKLLVVAAVKAQDFEVTDCVNSNVSYELITEKIL